MGREICRRVPLAFALLFLSMPAWAQVDLTGSWAPRLYEDYIERGPGSDLGDFTGMPMNDEARAKALLYTSNQPSTVERQCLPQAPWVVQYRPRGISIWAEEDRDGQIISWKLGGDYLRDTVTIWMDGRPEPSPNSLATGAGFTSGAIGLTATAPGFATTAPGFATTAPGLAATVGPFLGGSVSVRSTVCTFVRMLRAPGYGEVYEAVGRQQRYRHTGRPPRDGGGAGR